MEPTPMQKIIKELSCPGCFRQTASPPLLQCTSGHISCTQCSEKPDCCPACKSSETKKRNYSLERLCFSIKLNCSFGASGCHFSGTGIDVALHEEHCFLNNNPVNALARPSEEPRETLELASSSLDEAILAELECPVCKAYISPPIVFCENGHNFCSDCSKRLHQCPVCRGPKSTWRNFILERLYNLVQIPCRYVHAGCEISEKGLAIVKHETLCKFTPWSCPLTINRICRWHGLEGDVVNHCQTIHPDRFHSASVLRWNVAQFLRHKRYFSICYFEGVLFRCGFDKRNNYVRFNVNYLGNKLSFDRFSYELNIHERYTDNVWISKSAPCSHVLNDSYDSVKPNCLQVHADLLRKCFDSDDGLRYSVKIIDNSKTPL